MTKKEERRKEKRTSIDGIFEIEDEYYKEMLGTLVDISPKGLRIKGKEPIEVNDEVRLRISLPEMILGQNSVSVTAVCVWSKPDSESSTWFSGFEFYRVSQKASSLILGLILETSKTG